MGGGHERVLIVAVAAVWAVAIGLGVIYLASGHDPAADLALAGSEQQKARPASGTLATGTTSGSGSTGAASAATAPTASSTTVPPAPLRIAAGGDVIGDRDVGAFIDENGGAAVFANVAPLLSAADLAFVNLESPLSDKGTRNTAKDVTFRGRPALIKGLDSAGVDVVSLANNHALDWGSPALVDTIKRLDAAGIAHAGAGADLAAARAPAIVDTPGGSVAVLAYTLILPEGFSAGASRAGVNPGRTDVERVLADISAASKKADRVIVSFHWGTEYTGRASREQRALAHDAVDAGADLVLAHHPHVLQGMEIYRDKLIAYSLGDFVFDHYSRATGEAVVLDARLQPAGPPAVTLTPVYLSEAHGIPRVVTGAEADAILDRISDYSSDLGLRFSRDGDRAVYAPR